MDTQQETVRKKKKTPHTTVQKVCERVLPAFATPVLFSGPQEFRVAKLFLGSCFGAICGAVLYFGLLHKISIHEEHRIPVFCTLIGLCSLGCALSSYVRCSFLLIVPSTLGSRGRSYLMVFLLAGLFHGVVLCCWTGPISNIHHNVQDIALSLGCNMELQMNHSRVMWRVLMEPFKKVVQDIAGQKDKFEQEAQAVRRRFQEVREQVLGEYGYSALPREPTLRGHSTQDMFAAKTMLRCDSVVEEGISRCRLWFHGKWEECMRTIAVPLLNHLLCLPMTFSFLCDIMRVMTPWCRERIPVEGNFGQTYDKLNASIESLGDGFSTTVVFRKTEQQTLLGTAFSQAQIREELRQTFLEKKLVMEQLVDFIQLLLSCTFVFILLSAYGYTRNYLRDVRFDNVYVTTYFRQIDARRRQLGKRHLLPLKKAEKPDFIFPWSPCAHSCELRILVLGLLQVIPLCLFIGTLLAVDWLLYRIFTIIRSHSYTQYSFTSSHHIEITIGGQSMMATLLRKTIGAFNISSSMDMRTSNTHCLPQPRALSQSAYLWSTLPLLLMVLLCWVQIYSNRLRRVIAAFFFPKREKQRVLFLYNEQLRRRMSYVQTQRQRLIRQARAGQAAGRVSAVLSSLCGRLGCQRRGCCVCGEPQREGGVVCPLQSCGAVYCLQCWRDLGQFCFACTALSQHMSGESNSDAETRYAE
nr:PREDICTED: DC-STAMP domain-containing protein 1 isoform X1 [Lepisosteus oculatus]